MKKSFARHAAVIAAVGTAALLVSACSTGGGGDGADYPTRPIELWIGVSPGGGTDSHTRLLAPYLKEELGQDVIVVNKPGGSGISMWSQLPSTEADGYVLSLVSFPQLAGESVNGNLPYDPSDPANLTILGNASYNPTAMAVAGSRDWTSVADMVAEAKSSPGAIKVGTTGPGSLDFLSLSAVAQAEGVEFTYVPFPGTSEGINAVLSGDIDVMGMGLVSAGSFVESGDLKLLAIGADERAADYPDVETYSEQGYEILGGNPVAYFTMVAPPGLPDEIREKLEAAVEAATADPGYIEQIEAIGGGVSYLAPDEMTELVKTQISQLGDLLG